MIGQNHQDFVLLDYAERPETSADAPEPAAQAVSGAPVPEVVVLDVDAAGGSATQIFNGDEEKPDAADTEDSDPTDADQAAHGQEVRLFWTRRTKLVAGLLAALFVAGAATAVATYLVPGAASRIAAVHASTAPPGAITYTNRPDGYQITYPAAWQRSDAADGSVLLDINGSDAVSIRRFPLAKTVDDTNLAAMRSVTDAILSDPSAHLSVIDSQQVSVDGLSGMYYLYYYPAPHGTGVHAHYFLFSGKQMYTLVFQAATEQRFQELAATFDTVVASFKVTDK